MTIDLLQTASDKRAVSKSFTTLQSDVQCTVKQPCAMSAPTFVLHFSSAAMSCNYLYCADLGRYFYVTEKTLLSGERIELQCRSDVLMSFASDILNITTTIVRHETAGVNEIPDSLLPLSPTKRSHTMFLSNAPFNLESASALSFNFVLNVSGGAGTGGTQNGD